MLSLIQARGELGAKQLAARGLGQFLVSVLQLVELPVDAAPRKKLLVRAQLTKLSLVHYENLAGTLHGGEAMSDYHRCASLHHALQRGSHAQFSVGIDARGSFVQDEDAGIVRECARKVDELLLAGGEAIAALAYRLLESTRQARR